MWKLFPGTFQDLTFDILKSQHLLKNVEHVSWTCILLSVSWSPSPVHLCHSCVWGFGPSTKTCPWSFGVCILWILSFFNDFRAPQSLCICVTEQCFRTKMTSKIYIHIHALLTCHTNMSRILRRNTGARKHCSDVFRSHWGARKHCAPRSHWGGQKQHMGVLRSHWSA